MNMNVSLTDELVAFVKAKVGTCRYTSSSEVVREALRLMEKQEEEKLAWLRQAFKQGIESGDAGELDLDALKAEGVLVVRVVDGARNLDKVFESGSV